METILPDPGPDAATDAKPDAAPGGARRSGPTSRGRHAFTLRLEAAGAAAWRAELPGAARGRWCRLAVPGVAGALRLTLVDEARGHRVRELFLRRSRLRPQVLQALLHVPGEARALRLDGFGPGWPGGVGGAPTARLRVLSRAEAALRLLAGVGRLAPALRGSPLGLAGRLRATLGRAPAGARPDYAAWVRLYDRRGEADRAALLRLGAGAPPIRVVVLGGGAALRASLDALAAQWRPAEAVAVNAMPPDDAMAGATAVATAGAAAGAAGYVAILQAGEVLAAHALALVAGALVAGALAGGVAADVVYADEDRLRGDGSRDAPVFRPAAGEALLLSGLLTRGLVLVRAGLLRQAGGLGGWADDWVAEGAEAVRLRLWLRAGPGAVALHLPFVLTHRCADAAAAPAAVLAGIVQAHLGARGDVAADVPLRVRRRPLRAGSISVLVPSACRSRHVPACLARVLADTAQPIAEVLVAVSRVDASDRRQAAVLRRVAALPRVRVLDFGLDGFNYARVNNLAAAQAQGDMLLLLNDDVAPLRPREAAHGRAWLGVMAAHLEDAGVGAVGARLLYGDGRVQHGGVVLGLGGLAEHADRLRARGDPGPHGLCRVDREMSAVTAACLLLRRATWAALGGMDERFAVALNDVDLCLRLRGLGLGVRQANTAELYHYESLSLGRHYAGARAGLEAREVRLLRALHGAALAADPFHSANLSLEPGAADRPAFPPRADESGLWPEGVERG